MNDNTYIKLNNEQLEHLSTFMLEHADYSMLELMGFFAALASGPRNVRQEEWMKFLELSDEFKAHEDAPEILGLLNIVFNNAVGELSQAEYKPVAFQVIQESESTPDEVTDLLLDWIDGFWLGLELFGDEWVDTDHQEAEDLIFALGELDKHLLEDESEPNATPEDFAFVQTSVKELYDYWSLHKNCNGKPICKVAHS